MAWRVKWRRSEKKRLTRRSGTARDAAAKDKADGAKLEAKDAAVQRKREKVYRDWLKRLKKGAYYSVTGKAERKRPSKKGITQKRAWSDSPPSPPPEVL